MCAREFSFWEVRNDTFSPASTPSIQRLLPAMLLSGCFPATYTLASFDISDAYLMVPQEKRRLVKILDHHEVFIIDKLLPGQRKGSKLWYEFFVKDLVEQVGV